MGSVSYQGAESNLLPSFVEKIAAMEEYKGIGYHQLLANSFLISADAGHAVSPSLKVIRRRAIRSDGYAGGKRAKGAEREGRRRGEEKKRRRES